MKDISVVLLSSGDYIIGQYEEDFEGLRVRLTNSYTINGTNKITLTPFPKYSSVNACVMYRDSVVTMTENVDVNLLKTYLSKVGNKLENKPEPEFLTESPVIRDDTVSPDLILGDDEIEDEMSLTSLLDRITDENVHYVELED